MNGDPNSVRDDILGALALLEAAIADPKVEGGTALQIAFACASLRRANEKLRPEFADNVIPIRGERYSWKVNPA